MPFGESHNSAAKRAMYREHERYVTRHECADPKGRKRREKNVEKWLRFYFPAAFYRPFSESHRQIAKGATNAIDDGGRFAVAAPRGIGKSTELWGVSLHAVLSGKVKFPGYLPWSAKDRKGGLRFWKNALCFNEILAADYPEYCDPFVVSKGSAQKLLALIWEDTRAPCGAKLQVFEGAIVFPDGLGVIGGSTLKGNPRGLNHSAEDGSVLRPDMLLVDDPQDRKTANSQTMTEEAIRKIDSDVAYMGEAGKKLPMLMACTIMKTGDVSDHYINNAGWDSIRVGLIKEWPTGWDDGKSKCYAAWTEFGDIIKGQDHKHDGGKMARAYYRKHKDVMTKGMTMTDKNCYDKARKQPDAKYAAIEAYYTNGAEAFMAESQNQPLEVGVNQYTLTTAMVCAHTIDLPRLELPSTSTIFNGHCDINRSGLHWCLSSFDQQMSGHGVAYGRHPQRGELWAKNAVELIRKQAIFRGLAELCKQIAATEFRRDEQKVRLGILLIDRGYEPDVVGKFCATASYPFRVIPARGYAAQKYRPVASMLIGKPMESCHLSKSQFGNYLAFNADIIREQSQRAFLGTTGEPGGYTLHSVSDPRQHMPFAEQAVAEKLVNKYQTDHGPRWEWAHQPGAQWDWGDALTGCYAGALMSGLSASGVVLKRKKYVEKRKPKAVIR